MQKSLAAPCAKVRHTETCARHSQEVLIIGLAFAGRGRDKEDRSEKPQIDNLLSAFIVNTAAKTGKSRPTAARDAKCLGLVRDFWRGVSLVLPR